MNSRDLAPGRGGGRGRWLTWVGLLLGLASVVWVCRKEWRGSGAMAGQEQKAAGERGTVARPVRPPGPRSSAFAHATVTGGRTGDLVDESVMLPALKQWIKRREGKEVEVVERQPVCDAAGRPVSLNVLVTSLPGGLSADELRRRLAVMAVSEQGLRDRMRAAYGQQDTQMVNRLAAEFTEARSAFITTNQVSSYKVNLSKEDPPILAFWAGLTYETVREVEARELAARALGETAALHRLVACTSVASLLCFTNQAGETVYVDPVRLALVTAEVVADQLSARRATPEDADRDLRIANQWREMLEPDQAGPTSF